MVGPKALELLQKIADNTDNSNPIWVAAIAGLAALLGAGVAGWATSHAARRAADAQLRAARTQGDTEIAKVRASLVSTERLRWLQDLRTKVAEFFAYLDVQLVHIDQSLSPNQPGLSRAELEAISQEVRVRGNQIMLMLNREKAEQGELLTCVNDSLIAINEFFARAHQDGSPPNRDRMGRIKSVAFEAMRKIGDKAWSKVQGLE